MIAAASTSLALAAALVLTAVTFQAQTRQPGSSSGLRFDVSFVPQIHDAPITGRAFVMVTRSIDKEPEPRLQIGRTGVPFFGRDVERLEPEKIVAIAGSDPGTLYSSVEKVHLDPAAGGVVKLVATRKVPPVEVAPDTKYVKRIKFQSPM